MCVVILHASMKYPTTLPYSLCSTVLAARTERMAHGYDFGASWRTVYRPQQLYHQTIKLPLVILRNLIRCLIYKRFSVLTDFVKDWNCFKTLFFYSL
jgi:hypothetical protein